jgi:hypothetical protein
VLFLQIKSIQKNIQRQFWSGKNNNKDLLSFSNLIVELIIVYSEGKLGVLVSMYSSDMSIVGTTHCQIASKILVLKKIDVSTLSFFAM